MDPAPGGPGRVLPGPLRRPAAVVVMAGVVLLTVLAARYHDQHGYGRLDGWVLHRLLAALHGHGHVLWRVVQLASPPSVVVATGVLALGACLLRAWLWAALAILGPGATGITVVILKQLIGRTLTGGLAMPSGHTAGATAVATVLALMALSRARERPVAGGLLAFGAVTVVAGVVGISMTALRLHYATDTLGGWGAGLAATLSVAFVVDAVARRVRRPRGAAVG